MYNLQLSPEQLEFRETVQDFVNTEIRPAATSSDRLEPFEKPLLEDLLEQASAMGLRSLALSEQAGGAGANTQTSCIVLEELGAGDVDLAVAIAETSRLGHLLFDRELSDEQRARYLPRFLDDPKFHLALAGSSDRAAAGWTYFEPAAEDDDGGPIARREDGAWVIDGALGAVVNAPIARLFVVEARTEGNGSGNRGTTAFLVPAESAGVTVHAPPGATGERTSAGEPAIRWASGPVAGLTFSGCRVADDQRIGAEGRSAFSRPEAGADGGIGLAAVNLGLGRAAYEAAIEYAGLRRQGGRNIIEHQAIGAKVADMAVRLELARTIIWKAAWAADHPEAARPNGRADPPLETVARVYTAEAVHEVTLLAAELFGAMGVMRDMPLQKYVHDGLAFLTASGNDIASKLLIAEAVAGHRH